MKLPQKPLIRKSVSALDEMFLGLSPEERKVAKTIISEWAVSKDEEILSEIWNRDYIDSKPPIDPEDFFTNPYYIGEFGSRIHKPWLKDLFHVCDPTKNIEEWALIGAQGTGKTTVAVAAQVFKFYQLSCLKNPQEFYGFSNISNIYFGLLTLNLSKGKELYDKFLSIVNQSPYFRDRFPSKVIRGLGSVDKGDEWDDVDDWGNKEIVFPRRVRVVIGSKTSHALSLDLISGILDEMNWRRLKTVRAADDVNSAQHLYEQVRTRIRGRFDRVSHVPGIICSISSSQSTTDFMAHTIARMRKEPERCHISDYALWDIKDPDRYSGRKFFILMSPTFNDNRIIKPEEYEKLGIDTQAKFDFDWRSQHPNILAAPEEYLSVAEMNVNTFLRDVAGVATANEELLFYSPQLIEQCVDKSRVSPFRIDEITLGIITPRLKDIHIKDYLIDSAITHYNGTYRKPKYYPNASRFLHVDLAKNQGFAGMAMGCVAGLRNIITKTEDGKTVTTVVPIIWYDFIIRLKTEAGDQIDFDKIRSFIIYLRTIGFNIAVVSYDSFQSTDSMQMLLKAGFTVDYISTVRSDLPYLSFRDAFAQKRVNIYSYQPVLIELRELIYLTQEEDIIPPDDSSTGNKGTKDLADSMCGVYTSITKSISSPKAVATINLGHVATQNDEPVTSVKEMFERLRMGKNKLEIRTDPHAGPLSDFIVADYNPKSK